MEKMLVLIGKITLILVSIMIGLILCFYIGQRILKCKLMIFLKRKEFDKKLLSASYKYLCKTAMGRTVNFIITEEGMNSPEFRYAEELYEYTSDIPFKELIFRFNPLP